MRAGSFAQKMGQHLEHNCESIDKLKMTWAGLTEQDFGPFTTFPRIRKAIGDKYRILTENHGGHSQETPILFRRKRSIFWRITDVEVQQISEDLGAGIGNDRWQILVRAEQRRPRRAPKRFKAKKLGLIWTHWNAAIQDRPTGKPLSNERWRAMNQSAGEMLQTAIQELKREGREVIVGGDFNYRDKGLSHTWEWAPENIFRRNKMKFHSEGLDYLAWTGGLKPKDGVQVIFPNPNNPNALNRSDHPWLWADFRWVK